MDSADDFERKMDAASEKATRSLARVSASHGLIESDVNRFNEAMDMIRSRRLTLQPLRMRSLLSPRVEPYSRAPTAPNCLSFNVAGGRNSALPMHAGSELSRDQWDRFERLKRKGLLKGPDLELYEQGAPPVSPFKWFHFLFLPSLTAAVC